LQKIAGVAGANVLNCRADPMLLSADHGIPLGLLINELVTNAVKHGYPDGAGMVEISAREIDGRLHVEVSDRGVGLPEGFDIDQPRTSLGFRVITGLVRRLHDHLTVAANAPSGALFLFELPILPDDGGCFRAAAAASSEKGMTCDSERLPAIHWTCGRHDRSSDHT
jgi:two-component sensor histidine kinase